MKTGGRERLPLLNPFPGLWNGSRYIHLCLFDGVDELYITGKEADSTIRI